MAAGDNESFEIVDVPLREVQEAMDEAIAEGKWPLLLDSNENSPLITFFQYQSMHLIEAKKGFVEVKIRKTKTVEEVQEEWRQAVRDCLVQRPALGSSPGRPLWLHLDNSAVDMKGTFTGGALHRDLFDAVAMRDDATKRKFITDGDGLREPIVWGDQFRVVITSRFEKEDAVDFLKNSLPLDKLKIINITVDN